MFKNICIIGAGNIGSRHLQALAKIRQPLHIEVIDPYKNSLKNAKEKYDSVENNNTRHEVTYLQNLKDVSKKIDVAIIATTADIRSEVTKNLLEKSQLKYIIFEKLLFQKKEDYKVIGKLLHKKRVRAWINCPMRTTPFYTGLKKHFKKQVFYYNLVGSGFGFITGLIHYIDHMAFLTDCYDYTVDTNNLSKTFFESKRKGFLETTGTLDVHFKNGSIGSFSCLPGNDLYLILEIFSKGFHYVRNELDNKNYYAGYDLKPKTTMILTPYQSEMTNEVISSLLKSGQCKLTPFNLSSKLHITFLDALLVFLNKYSKRKYKYYPFT